MRTGEHNKRSARGFTYLWLLFAIAIGGASLAVASTQWRTATQREKERELLFRGEEIARAIASYRSATPQGAKPWPSSFDELVDDRRALVVRRHLRRIYTDPFTGRADWLLIGQEGIELRGVRSRADVKALLTREFGPGADEAGAVLVSDKVFGSAMAAPMTAQAASAAIRVETGRERTP